MPSSRSEPLSIGVVCYPTYGGSGIVATELGLALAERGHAIHFFSYSNPVRLVRYHPRVFFHQVDVPPYPLFKYPPYDLALASKMATVARDERIDVFHVHYAIPHSISAFLARSMLGRAAPKVVTTLHGTDIVLVGTDPSYREATRFGIDSSDAVVAVSRFLRDETVRLFDIRRPIEVIPNFVDTDSFHPSRRERSRGAFTNDGEVLLVHASNFRPLKRVLDVLRIFDLVRRVVPSRLVLLGDGPDRGPMEEEARRLGLRDRIVFLGPQEDVAPPLASADVFLLPSETESFGLSALEALACGVPVVGSRVGGLPEVVDDGGSGFLHPVGDFESMAASVIRLVENRETWAAFSARARRRAVESFAASRIIDTYEQRLVSVTREEAAKTA